MEEHFKMMSYVEYLKATNQKDCRKSWQYWKMEVCGMSEREAIKASYDSDWGIK